MSETEPPTDKPDERWRWVPGYEERYKVSTHGRVWSTGGPSLSPRLLSKDTSYGYERVVFSVDGVREAYLVHRLVLKTFERGPGEDEEASHLNGVRDDNRLENLTWESRERNHRRRRRHKTDVQGEKHPNSELTAWDVRFVRFLRRHGFPYRTIMDLTGLSKAHVGKLVNYDAWPHLE